MDRRLRHFFIQLHRDGFSLREIGILILIGAILYSYFISNFSISIDGESAALRPDHTTWISQQRWFVSFIEQYLFPQPSIYFSPYLLLVISLAISYTMILRTHGYQENWRTYIAYPIFCLSASWWTIATFPANIPSLAFGVFFISLSSYLYFGGGKNNVINRNRSLLRNSLIVIMLACAISAYQSLLLMFMCFSCGILLIRCRQCHHRDKLTFIAILKILSNLLLLILLAIALYSIINTVTQKIFISDSGYIADNFIKYNVFLKTPLTVIDSVFREMLAIYSGSYTRYGASIHILGVVIFIATIIISFTSTARKLIVLPLWIAVLTIPFALHVIAGGYALPLRTLLAISYVSWLSSIIILSSKRPIFVFLSISLISLFQIKNTSLISQYIASAKIVESHDRILAADIYRRVGELSEDFDRNSPIKIDIYGSKSFNTIYAVSWHGTMQASFFEWDRGSIARIINYMKVMGYENIVFPSIDERLSMTPIFEKMPAWPAAGSVKKVNDLYLVKLGNQPDPAHAEYKK